MQTNLKSNKPQGARNFHRRPQGFTLVELLIVIAILGILAGLLTWGVSAARTAILKRAQKFEIEMIAQAIEQYRTKYGDYPPDGSSWPLVEAHLRKAFPNILVTELNLLNPVNAVANATANNNVPISNDNDATGTHPLGGRVMDSAEALVFFLGGFSSDPQRPLTGPGGPFKSLAPNGVSFPFVYNTQRENSFYEFKTSRLTLRGDTPVSSDEQVYGETMPNNSLLPPDLLPVFIGAGPSIQQGGVPIVYFDSRTYLISTPTNGVYFNFYTPGSTGVANNLNYARPYLSTDKEPNSTVQQFANNRSFQLINAGYDRIYGGRSISKVTNPTVDLILFVAPTGQPCLPFLEGGKLRFRIVQDDLVNPPFAATKYVLKEFEDNRIRPVEDNISNFTETPTLGESL